MVVGLLGYKFNSEQDRELSASTKASGIFVLLGGHAQHDVVELGFSSVPAEPDLGQGGLWRRGTDLC